MCYTIHYLDFFTEGSLPPMRAAATLDHGNLQSAGDGISPQENGRPHMLAYIIGHHNIF